MSQTYIYSRVSTDLQSTDAQLVRVKEQYPKAIVISETASGAKQRPMLDSLVSKLSDGDVLVVYALDRLGRRASEVLTLLESLQEKGVVLKSIREGADFSSPVGKLIMQIMISVAEMERNLVSERTRAGVQAARESGKRLGRPPTQKKEQALKAAKAVLERNWKVSKAAAKWDVHVTYVYAMIRTLKVQKLGDDKEKDHARTSQK